MLLGCGEEKEQQKKKNTNKKKQKQQSYVFCGTVSLFGDDLFVVFDTFAVERGERKEKREREVCVMCFFFSSWAQTN